MTSIWTVGVCATHTPEVADVQIIWVIYCVTTKYAHDRGDNYDTFGMVAESLNSWHHQLLRETSSEDMKLKEQWLFINGKGCYERLTNQTTFLNSLVEQIKI